MFNFYLPLVSRAVFGNIAGDNVGKYLENFNSVYISNEHTIVPVFSVYLLKYQLKTILYQRSKSLMAGCLFLNSTVED